MFSLGIDSGAHSGISLLFVPAAGRPRVELAFGVLGTRQELWLDRAVAALCEIKVFLNDRPFVAGMEEPPVSGKAASLHGDPRGQRTWQGMGRRRGMLEALCYVHLGVVPRSFPQVEWTRALFPIVAKKKLGEGKAKGLHRIREAVLLMDGAKEGFSCVPDSCRVDVAESMLISMASAALIRQEASVLGGS